MLTTIGEGVDEEESSRINMVGSVNIEDSEDFRDRTLEFRSLVGTLKPSSEAFKYQQEEQRELPNAFEITYKIILSDISKLEFLESKFNSLVSVHDRSSPKPEINKQMRVLLAKIQKSEKNILQLKQIHENLHLNPKSMLNRHNLAVIKTLEGKLHKLAKNIKNMIEDFKKWISETNERQKRYSNRPWSETEEISMNYQNIDIENNLQNHHQMVTHMEQNSKVNEDYEAMRVMQETVMTIAQYTQDLNQIVMEQGEMIVRIDDNVEQANQNLITTRQNLVIYLDRLIRDRCFVFKLIGIFSIFLMIYLYFF